MENEITAKRGLILILVMATVAVFIGLVWLIATYLPWNLLGGASPKITQNPQHTIKNCTYPISFWTEHPELYPPQILFGSKVYKANEIREVLTQEEQDLSAKLQAQLVVAFLNFSSGADQAIIETTIFQAYGWLVQHPEGSEASSSEIETGLRYFSLLETYNLGLAGVEACPEGPTPTKTETIIPSETATIFLTVTSSQTLSLTPTGTPSPTGQLATPINTLAFQSQTPIPTTQSPGVGQPTITRTTAPSPTKTAIKTTEAPTSTRTPTKAVTATHTQSFQSSPTYTRTAIPPSPTNTQTPKPPSPTNTQIPIPTSTSTPIPTLPPTLVPTLPPTLAPTLPPTSAPTLPSLPSH
jgi:hypothetical protein